MQMYFALESNICCTISNFCELLSSQTVEINKKKVKINSDFNKPVLEPNSGRTKVSFKGAKTYLFKFNLESPIYEDIFRVQTVKLRSFKLFLGSLVF